MQRSTKIFIAAAGAAILIGGWYAFRPERLWIDNVVSEDFDTTAVGRAGAANGGVAAPAAAAMPPAASTPDSMVDGPGAIAAGSFHSNAHETKGTATIYRRADGTRVLRLADFETSNGPDVRVYLVAAPDVKDDATVKSAGFIELGKLKGNKGNQNYEVPASVDLAKYRSVTIWCKRFSVNFGTAPLSDRLG